MNIDLFTVLDSVDSTNNYAIEKIKKGLGKNGAAWFAKEQFDGKGQRGKSWKSEPEKNIILSIIIKPNSVFYDSPFYLSALVACICRSFIEGLEINNVKIKWPNDLYINDRKAAGILIENLYTGNSWDWAVIGIGLNINQTTFDDDKKTSILNETNIMYDVLKLAQKLHQKILTQLDNINIDNFTDGLQELNNNLYKKNEINSFLIGNDLIKAKILQVNKNGKLLVSIKEEIKEFGVGEAFLQNL